MGALERSGVAPKLNRGERPPTGQSREALRFRIGFRPRRTADAREVDKSSVRGEMGEDEEGLHPDESRSIEGLRHMRLMTLLPDMIDSGTGEKTAKALGGQLQNGV